MKFLPFKELDLRSIVALSTSKLFSSKSEIKALNIFTSFFLKLYWNFEVWNIFLYLSIKIDLDGDSTVWLDLSKIIVSESTLIELFKS